MGGINNKLYNKSPVEPTQLISQQEIMDKFNIKDLRTLTNFIDKEKFPYFKIGRKIFSTVEQYNKWVNSRIQNKYWRGVMPRLFLLLAKLTGKTFELDVCKPSILVGFFHSWTLITNQLRYQLRHRSKIIVFSCDAAILLTFLPIDKLHFDAFQYIIM